MFKLYSDNTDNGIAAQITNPSLRTKYDLRKSYTQEQFYNTEFIPEDATDPTEPFMIIIEKSYIESKRVYEDHEGLMHRYFKANCFFFEPEEDDDSFKLEYVSSSYYILTDEGYVQAHDEICIPEDPVSVFTLISELRGFSTDLETWYNSLINNDSRCNGIDDNDISIIQKLIKMSNFIESSIFSTIVIEPRYIRDLIESLSTDGIESKKTVKRKLQELLNTVEGETK